MSQDNRPSFFGFGTKPNRSVGNQLNGCLDFAVLSLGYLVLIGWLPNNARLSSLTLSTSGRKAHNCKPAVVRYQRNDVTKELGHLSPFKPGFLCVIPVDLQVQMELSLCITNKLEIVVGVEMDAGTENRLRAIPIPLASAIASGAFDRTRLQMTAEVLQGIKTENADLAQKMLLSLHGQKTIPAHIDFASTVDGRQAMLGGWLERASEGSIYLLPSSLATTPELLKAVVTARSDVSEHLRNIGRRPNGNLHGFAAVANEVPSNPCIFCKISGNEIEWSNEISIESKAGSQNEYFGNMRRLATESNTNTSLALQRLLGKTDLSLLASKPDVAGTYTFGSASVLELKPTVSIIVPFYGEDFYLLDHIFSQARAPSNVEWIFVCDDPRLGSSMHDALKCRQSLILQRTTLVLLASNGGFANANNIGAGYANGDYLLHMNSDILCEQFDFIDYSASHLSQNLQVGCVGFSLQFEDGTIQHDGITFATSNWLDGLWVCEHRDKGMPQDWKGFSLGSADAVTAALLMIRRSDFDGQQIFDPSYLVGDFEDADLCLRLRARGKEIALVKTPGLYHLERQSLKYTGDNESRIAITHVNCLTFNNRWSSTLTSNSGSFT